MLPWGTLSSSTRLFQPKSARIRELHLQIQIHPKIDRLS
jgi:hypothetical protein